VLRTGTAVTYVSTPGNAITVEEVDGDPSGSVNKIVFSNDTVTIVGNTATVTSGGGGVDTQYHDRYNTEAETLRSGATANVELYYTARADGDGIAESATSDEGETETINRTLYYSDKHRADPDTAADWTEYTTQPADNASFATAKAALLQGLNETDATAETRGTLPLSLKMVRTTTAASQLLLDDYPNAAAAYSVRKLDKDYTGYCMRVRRDSDEATQDIGFDGNGDLDTAAIATFCSGAYGYVSRWYDQSGNGIDATQNTGSAQPMIYDRVAAAVVTENGKPSLEFDDSASQHLDLPVTGTVANATGVLVRTAEGMPNTHEGTAFNYKTFGITYGHKTNNAYRNAVVFRNTYAFRLSTYPTTDEQALDFFTALETSSGAVTSNVAMYRNSVTGDSGVTANGYGSGTNQIGAWQTQYFRGGIQELLIWESDQSSNRTGIETNINDYYSIY